MKDGFGRNREVHKAGKFIIKLITFYAFMQLAVWYFPTLGYHGSNLIVGNII